MMGTSVNLEALWRKTGERLTMKQLLTAAGSLSIRCPDGTGMWFGQPGADDPKLVSWRTPNLPGDAAVHALIYSLRGDVGAIAWGGGRFGRLIAEFGGHLPPLFDEQVRHLGRMPPAANQPAQLQTALAGRANYIMLERRLLCLGMTGRRLVLNAELFEKCANAFIPAVATGMKLSEIPRWVQRIAAGRLKKEQDNAQAAFAAGTLPAEVNSY